MDTQNDNHNPLTHLTETTRAHWQKYRPMMYAALEASGNLEVSIAAAVQQTETAIESLMQQHGLSLLEAWEAVREEWILLPAEDDELEEEMSPVELWDDADDWDDDDEDTEI